MRTCAQSCSHIRFLLLGWTGACRPTTCEGSIGSSVSQLLTRSHATTQLSKGQQQHLITTLRSTPSDNFIHTRKHKLGMVENRLYSSIGEFAKTTCPRRSTTYERRLQDIYYSGYLDLATFATRTTGRLNNMSYNMAGGSPVIPQTPYHKLEGASG